MVADTMVVTMAVDTMVVIHTDTEDTGVKHIMSTKKKYSNFTTKNVSETIITR